MDYVCKMENKKHKHNKLYPIGYYPSGFWQKKMFILQQTNNNQFRI